MACGEFELDAAKEVKIGDRLKKLVDQLTRVHSMHYYHVPDLCVAENHYQNIPFPYHRSQVGCLLVGY
jgi:hypothetical protein